MTPDLESILNKLEQIKLPMNHIVYGLPVSVIEGKSQQEVFNLMRNQNDPQYNIITGIHNSIEKERDRLVQECREYYYNGIGYDKLLEQGLTPMDICKEVWERVLRASRLSLVFEPDYYKSTTANKKDGERYDSVKLMWLDDKGERFRKITKTYGKEGSEGLEHAIPKMMDSHLDNLSEYTLMVSPYKGLIFDMMAVINEESWVFEFKLTKKDDFIQMAVRLDFWKLYKKTYGLK